MATSGPIGGNVGPPHSVVNFTNTFAPYDPAQERVTDYVERFELFMRLNNIPRDSWVAYLLTFVGGKVYAVLKDLLIPDTPIAVEYTRLVEVFQNYYVPIKMESVSRVKFRQYKQSPGESITQFVHKLKSLAKDCNFGPTLSDALKDQVLVGVASPKISRALLMKENLTFDVAVSTCLAMETADRDATFLMSGVASTPSTGNSSAEGTSGVPTVNYVHAKKKGEFQKKKTSSGMPVSASGQGREGRKCYRCGSLEHLANGCPRAHYKCRNCGKVGHLSTVCRSKKNEEGQRGPFSTQYAGRPSGQAQQKPSVNQVEESLGHLYVNNVTFTQSMKPCFMELQVNGQNVKFEVDTGASLTVLGYKHWQMIGRPVLSDSHIIVKAVNTHKMKVLGKCLVTVSQHPDALSIIVVDEDLKFPLLGRSWLDKIRPAWRDALVNNIVTTDEFVNVLKQRFKNVFTYDGTCIVGHVANVVLKPGATPIFRNSYKVPYALAEQVKDELQRLIKMGVLVPVAYSEWASPMVCIRKPNGQIRICFDYKNTLNPQIQRDVYVLPTVEDIFAKMVDAKVFCVLDCKEAYLSLKMGEESQKVLTVNTPLGLLKVTRMPYGVCNAPLIYQAVIDQIIQGIPGTASYQDDLIISGINQEQCRDRVLQVFAELSRANIKVNIDKCQWFVEECIYLGHSLSANGIRPKPDKADAIINAPVPRDVTALKAWLGLISYYRAFLCDLSSILKPLYFLTQQNVRFVWSKSQDDAFRSAKHALLNSSALAFFNPSRKIIITCDSSSYGVGSVMSQIDEEGKERPVLFHSATLDKAMQNYSQLERESLAIITAVKRYHRYIFGRKFLLRTDHRPLQYIFAPDKVVPAMTSAKLQRWALYLSAFDYELEFVPGKLIANADGLSRCPLSEPVEEVHVNGMSVQGELPVSYMSIAEKSKADPVLSVVIDSVWRGWRYSGREMNDVLKTFYNIRDELSVEEGVLLRNHKVVIPKILQGEVLKLLHEGHSGVVRTKALARQSVWWPAIDKDIERMVAECVVCQTHQSHANQPKVNSVWPKPDGVWDRVHMDFFDLDGVKYLLLVDSYSGWVECWKMSRTDAKSVKEKLDEFFATHALVKCIVSDNGPPFNSEFLSDFFAKNGVKFIHSPPYHPQSNTFAERHVGTIKRMLKKCGSNLQNVLFHYRTVPRSNGVSPYQIVFKRCPNTRITLLNPRHKYVSNVPFSVKKFHIGQKVYVNTKAFSNVNWSVGEVLSQLSPTTYNVLVQGRVKLTHVDSMRECVNNSEASDPIGQMYDKLGPSEDTFKYNDPEDPPFIPNVSLKVSSNVVAPHSPQMNNQPKSSVVPTPSTPVHTLPSIAPVVSQTPVTSTPTVPRMSTRIRNPPIRLNL